MKPGIPTVQPSVSARDADGLYQFLQAKRVFEFDVFPTGMFPAVGPGSATEATSGYRAAWVRDNVHIAFAHHAGGHSDAAVRCVRCISKFYLQHLTWFTDIVLKKKSPADPMNRPHIRFDGNTGNVITEKWPHAQNDALGAFLWLLCRLINDGAMALTADTDRLLSVVIAYLEAIGYWQDEDSGHWEEQRKISASSIGAVNAGIAEYVRLRQSARFENRGTDGMTMAQIERLLATGTDAMNAILPAECIQTAPEKARRFDAALLFLVEPFQIVTGLMAVQIVDEVTATLQGHHGIRRYLLDSYWGPNYRRVPAEKRTIDLSNDIIQRDDFAVEAQEAQWCIFDSVVSIYYGRRYRQTGRAEYRHKQIDYLNRTLGQLVASPNTDSLQLPEAYFFESDAYVPNDHLPLQWAHANLWRAVLALRDNCDGNDS